jgi:phosphoribosyl 1,2-cyclic phosphate phosphodiesterase
VPREAVELARGAAVVVLDGLRPDAHPTHMTTGEAIEVSKEIGAPLNYLIHMTHAIDHGPFEATLPLPVRLAYDGLRVKL